MRSTIWNKRIPTYAGFLLLIIGVVITSFLVRTGVLFPIRATPSTDPQEVRVTNISDSSFTVSYVTAGSVKGSVAYGETDAFGAVLNDDRDEGTTEQLARTVHYFTVLGLKPETRYYFTIISGGKAYDDSGEPFSAVTGKSLADNNSQELILKGSLLLPDGTKPTEAIVYIEGSNTQVFSAVVGPDGTYSLPLKQIRTLDLSSYVGLGNSDILRLDATSGSLHSTAEVSTSVPEIPPITLSQQYEFTVAVTQETASPAAETAPVEDGEANFPDFDANKPVYTDPQILTPEKDETFSDQQPEFTGTAPPGKTVEILIESNHEIRASVKADKFGMWSYRPTTALEPGIHTITITTRDEAGILRTIVQPFVVNAQGSQFTEPSVSPTKSPTGTPRPTITTTAPTTTTRPTTQVTPTRQPTAVPTAQVTTKPTTTVSPTTVIPPTTAPSPTIITATPVVTAFPTQVVIQPTQPPVEPPGSEGLLVILSLTGFAVLAGSMLFFFALGGRGI